MVRSLEEADLEDLVEDFCWAYRRGRDMTERKEATGGWQEEMSMRRRRREESRRERRETHLVNLLDQPLILPHVPSNLSLSRVPSPPLSLAQTVPNRPLDLLLDPPLPLLMHPRRAPNFLLERHPHLRPRTA